MNPTDATSRLSAYFAFGVQWGSAPQAPRSDSNGAANARAGRVIDVKARRIDADPAARKTPVQLPSRSATNVFLPVTTYAPQPGQGIRLVQSGGNLGLNFDTWA